MVHISGPRNIVADQLSRQTILPSEWTLDPQSFSWILSLGVSPQVDLFATRENARMSQFVSPMMDDLAVAVDAFSLDWNVWRAIYLFPPTSLLHKVLTHLESFRGQALLVTPDWPNQSWFPALSLRARSVLPIPNPRLFQRVRGEIFWSHSHLYCSLLIWIL